MSKKNPIEIVLARDGWSFMTNIGILRKSYFDLEEVIKKYILICDEVRIEDRAYYNGDTLDRDAIAVYIRGKIDWERAEREELPKLPLMLRRWLRRKKIIRDVLKY